MDIFQADRCGGGFESIALGIQLLSFFVVALWSLTFLDYDKTDLFKNSIAKFLLLGSIITTLVLTIFIDYDFWPSILSISVPIFLLDNIKKKPEIVRRKGGLIGIYFYLLRPALYLHLLFALTLTVSVLFSNCI